ncbi:DnaB-like helicase N-terminal domain-containing protein [Streptomyces sp. NPDC004296]|uniref:DnaB-like helicase N-terminal domain-containing protein n=1 Tax=Streptomyces sp. NPDC004296 TaxID=3364697 RepID=UPI003682063B
MLRAMLRTLNAVADVVDVLLGDDFYRPAHELIYNAVLAVYARGETPDPVTVACSLMANRALQARKDSSPGSHRAPPPGR